MFCKTCGTPIEEGANACTVCGTYVDNPTPVETTNPQPVYSKPVDTVPAPTTDPGQSAGSTALAMGIVALAIGTIGSCLIGCLAGFASLVCAVIGIVMGIQAMNKSKAAGVENNDAKLGLILSIIAIALFLISIVINVVAFGFIVATGAYDNYYSYY